MHEALQYMCRWLKINLKWLNWTGAGQWDKLHHLVIASLRAVLDKAILSDTINLHSLNMHDEISLVTWQL